MAKRNPRLRAFAKIDRNGDLVPSTLMLRYKPPMNGQSSHNPFYELVPNVCCSPALSSFDFSLNGSTTGLFTLVVAGQSLATATNSDDGTFATPQAGQLVTATVKTSGPNESLVFVNVSQGAVLSNQTGSTGTLTYSWIATGEIISIIAFGGPTTTTTTSTTTTTTTTI